MIFDYREKNSKTRELCVDFFKESIFQIKKLPPKNFKKIFKTY